MKVTRGALTTILLFQLVFFFAFDSFAKNSRASRAATRLKLCADESGQIRVKIRCSNAEEEVSLSSIAALNAFTGELVTPNGVVIQSNESSVSIIAGPSTIEIDPLAGITLSSDHDLTISTGGALNLHGRTVKISSEISTEVKSSIETSVKGDTTTSITSGAITEIKGAIVKIN
ncbi:MAG: hypothetical protein KDD64_05875 [Bdellovibrionales bacterium]|nr:hypothetical protein [Bdellovibrionales bacterium]